MTSGTLIYKCRRCGRFHQSGHVPDVETALDHLTMSGTTPRGWVFRFQMTTLHRCDPVSFGISDLVGADPDPPALTP